jgi:hypothetical protein
MAYGIRVAAVRGVVDEILRYAGYGAYTVDSADVMNSAGGRKRPGGVKKASVMPITPPG